MGDSLFDCLYVSESIIRCGMMIAVTITCLIYIRRGN